MSTVTTVAARRQFDQAIAAMGTDIGAARTLFTEATRADPAMADAWLGRIAAGDDDLATLEQLHDCGARLHRESNRLGVELSASIKAGPHLSITVTEASHAGIALASALVDDGQFERAAALLGDPALLDAWENHQWCQYIKAYLMYATQRWPDVIAEAARQMRNHKIGGLPVVADGQLVGIITETDLLDFLIELLSTENVAA